MDWKLVLAMALLAAVVEGDRWPCEKAKAKLDVCRGEGYAIGNCKVGDGELSDRRRRKCEKMERKYEEKCDDYECEIDEPIDPGWKDSAWYEPYNMEILPVELLTKFERGSNNMVRLRFYDRADQVGRTDVGTVEIKFADTVQYKFGWCVYSDFRDFPNQGLIPTGDIIWRVTLSRSDDNTPRITVDANGVEVLDLELVKDNVVCEHYQFHLHWPLQARAILIGTTPDGLPRQWRSTCEAGEYFDQSSGCEPCPQDTWSIRGNADDKCNDCPYGLGVAGGMGKRQSDCRA